MGNSLSFKSTGNDHRESTAKLSTAEQPKQNLSTPPADDTGSYLHRLAKVISTTPYISQLLQKLYAFVTGYDIQTQSHNQIKDRKVCSPSENELSTSATTELYPEDTTPITDETKTNTKKKKQNKINKKKKKKNQQKTDTPAPLLTKTSKPTSTEKSDRTGATEDKTRTSNTPFAYTPSYKKTEQPILPATNASNTKINTADTPQLEEEFQLYQPKKKHQKLKRKEFNIQNTVSAVELPHTNTHQKLLSLPETKFKNIVKDIKSDQKITYKEYRRLINKTDQSLNKHENFRLGLILRKLLNVEEYTAAIIVHSLLFYCKHDPNFLLCINQHFPRTLAKIYHQHSKSEELKTLTEILITIFREGIKTEKKQQTDTPSEPAQPDKKTEPGDKSSNSLPPEELKQLKKSNIILERLEFKTMPTNQKCFIFQIYVEIFYQTGLLEHDEKKTQGIDHPSEVQILTDLLPDSWLNRQLLDSMEAIKDHHQNPLNYKNGKTAETGPNKKTEYNPESAMCVLKTCSKKLKLMIDRKNSEHHKSDYLQCLLATLKFTSEYWQFLDGKTKQNWQRIMALEKTLFFRYFPSLLSYNEAIAEIEDVFITITELTDKSIDNKPYLTDIAKKLFKIITDQIQEELKKTDSKGKARSTKQTEDLKSQLSKMKHYLDFYTENNSSRGNENQLAYEIESTLGGSYYDRLHCIIHYTRTTDKPEIEKKEKHIDALEKIKKKTIEWINQQEINGPQSTDHLRQDISNARENINLEIAKWYILHNEHEEAYRVLKETTCRNIAQKTTKARLLFIIDKPTHSLEEYDSIIEILPEEWVHRRHLMNAERAVTLASLFERTRDENQLIDALHMTLPTYIANPRKYSGQLFHILQELVSNNIPIKKELQELSSILQTSKSPSAILKRLHLANKNTDETQLSDASLQKLSEPIRKTRVRSFFLR